MILCMLSKAFDRMIGGGGGGIIIFWFLVWLKGMSFTKFPFEEKKFPDYLPARIQ